MRLKLTAIALALVAASAVVGASAFTTATLDRSANVDVVADSSGIVGLTAGTATGGVVSEDTDGALTIDFTPNSATGANVDAKFDLGDNSTTDFTAATTGYAFKLTNQDTAGHTFSIGYTPNAGAPTGDATESIKFEVYSDDGTTQTHLGTVSEESTSLSSLSVSSGSSLYVVVLVDTNGLTASSDTLSGTLTISA